ncbi:unnamed protein product [Mytilus coruscus]|uniref:Uncharacterized protein n=1 Tax=Mytilus coruscus TaxID=42192 RepID=A0A6J8BC99_MYTCO|nr:unnamed protein product [Mytilus coruscus]
MTKVKQTEDCESGVSSTNLELSVQEVSAICRCIECFKAIPVFSSDEIDEGDHIAFAGISNEMKSNEKEYDNGIICEKCFDMKKRLLDVKLRPIRKAEDVQKGNIIRTIIEEQLKINLNGKCNMLEYLGPVFKICDQDTVVGRAKKRVGEQQFVFFSNDSIHFARG